MGVSAPTHLIMPGRLLARNPVGKLTHDIAAGNITTGAYTQLSASIPAASTALEIFSTSSSIFVLALGSAGNEVDMKFYIFPGGSPMLPVEIPKGQRLSVIAVDTNATVGRLNINIFGGE